MFLLPRKNLRNPFPASAVLSLSLIVFAGCGYTANNPASVNSPAGATAAVQGGVPIQGHVGGEQWWVRNASIQLYSVGVQGVASAAPALLTQSVSTDANGNFKIAESYSCPSSTSQLYLVASGGTPVPGPVTGNQAIALMTMLGPCNGLSSSTTYPINEVTTIGAVWPLSPYMASTSQLGSNPNDQSLTAALTLVKQLVNLQQAVSPGVGVPAGEAVQTAKLYTLANDFHTCVLSAGGEAGDGSACGQLFSLATAPGSAAPKNTIEAALQLAKANQLNPEGLFQLVPGNQAYQPILPAPPSSWDLNLITIPPPPTFSPPAGAYSVGQQIVLSTTAPGAAIHYTTDGSQPSYYSAVYDGPLVLSATETINAVSMTEAISSSTATAAFSPSTKQNAAVNPSQVSLSESQSQQFTASLPGASNTAVTWSLSPAVGAISSAGLYTAPASITSAQTVTVTATSDANKEVSAHATVSLTPTSTGAAKVTVSPASASLSASQTQQFSAAVTGISNTAVTWSLNPAVGTISSAGLYTAPASITGAQTVTVTATSSANGTVSAHATVSLTPTSTGTVKVTVSPASVVLSASQNQQFTAAVTGTSNTAVTWSLSPVVGTISSAGLYTAPTTNATTQTVTVTATSSAASSASATATVTILPNSGTNSGTGSGTGNTYYLAPAGGGGSDSNSGLSATAPWLTPNHPLNCGDVIVAAASTSYSSANFRSGNWGKVSCPSANAVAWLKCAQFDACKITVAGGQPGIYVDQNFWGVQGWEVSANNSSASFCFGAAPNYQTPVTIHHIIFANNVANGCQQGGFTTFNSGKTASEDYIAIIGNIAYNAAQNGNECFSGISIYQPIQSDSLPGTHIYIAGNFSYGNVDANPCAGGMPTDGEGLIFDTFDGDQGGLPSYAAQAVADNNIFVSNGGRGLQVGNNSIGSGPFATIYLRHNTVWGNNGDRNQNTSALCGELSLFRTVNTTATSNLAETNQVTGCGDNPIYAFYVWGGNGTDDVDQNWGYAVSGTTSSGLYNSSGFSFAANNIFGQNPQFPNPVAPPAPSCGGTSNVPACMATVIANFKPANTAAASFGYQPPSSTPVYDPLFPQWLCTASVPTGLVTMGCQAQQ
ncbi:MAG TPA: chitobiase/beta-hexosaminidase C-terminal domain-containing protein [Acidobacteriaceae bacterium]|nr:chitobiase/beta-hexosaminidase C-terminal domain-containing protein [Acidobacteriaceae bacterium]